MSSDSVSRRHFLRGSGALAGGAIWPGGLSALLALTQTACSARDEAKAFSILSVAEAKELEAIAARIIPTTDTPGAREAGVIHFMDLALDSVFPDMLESVRTGLQETAANVGAAGLFSKLNEADQDAYLQSIEETDFFGGMRFLTFCGFFALSKYGGNRDGVGWKLLGMDPDQHAWQPPFGHYDAEYMQGERDGD